MRFNDTTFSDIETVIKNTVIKVLQKMTGSNFNCLSGLIPLTPEKKYITTIGLYGMSISDIGEEVRIRGSVVLAWDLGVYVEVCNAIFKEKYSEYCEDMKDLGMEILNTVIGNSRSDLKAKGIFIEMSLPNGFLGNQIVTELPEHIMLRETTIDSELGLTNLHVTCGFQNED